MKQNNNIIRNNLFCESCFLDGWIISQLGKTPTLPSNNGEHDYRNYLHILYREFPQKCSMLYLVSYV